MYIFETLFYMRIKLHSNVNKFLLFLNGFSQHKSNVYSLQGANILLTDNGDVKLGKFLFSIFIS